MNRRFLVASDDEPVSAWEPLIVTAHDKDAAIDRYLRFEYSKDPVFREGVLELTINGPFLSKFFFTCPSDDIEYFEKTGEVTFDLATVKSRVSSYFSTRPDLGEQFLRYMDTQDLVHVTDEVFEFISVSDPSGIVAMDLDEIRQL